MIRKQNMSAGAQCKFKRKSKLVSKVRKQKYVDTTTNEGERMKRYKGDKRQWLEHQSASLRVQIKRFQANGYMRTKTGDLIKHYKQRSTSAKEDMSGNAKAEVQDQELIIIRVMTT